MEREKTLYMYVYEQILMDIYRGKYKDQDKLPSLAQLCEQYEVGRNTLRTAIHQLEIEGYVISEKGTHARVCFNREKVDDNIRYCTSLAARRQSIRDVYDTLAILMPHVITASLRNASDAEITNLKEKIQAIRNDESITDEDKLNEHLLNIYLYALSFLHNEVLAQLFQMMMQYMFMPLSDKTRQGEKFSESIQQIKDTISRLLTLVMTGNERMLRVSIRLFCKQYKKVTDGYIGRICKDIEVVTPQDFQWISNRDQEYRYMQVITSIIRDIDQGLLKDGELLPPMAVMAEKYRVSLRTMRKVNEVLNEFGVVSTRNGVGTRVTMSFFHEQENLAANETLKKFLRQYCESLEVLYYLLKGCLKTKLMHASEEEYRYLAEEYESSSTFSLQPILDFVKKGDNSCTRIIVEELEKSVSWNLFMKVLKEQDPVSDLDALHKNILRALRKRNPRKVTKLILDLMEFAVSMNYENLTKFVK